MTDPEVSAAAAAAKNLAEMTPAAAAASADEIPTAETTAAAAAEPITAAAADEEAAPVEATNEAAADEEAAPVEATNGTTTASEEMTSAAESAKEPTTETTSDPSNKETTSAESATKHSDSASAQDKTESPQDPNGGGAAADKEVKQPRRNPGRKFKLDDNSVTDDPVKICTQVDFYFSDENLQQDKWLWEQTGGPQNKPVSLKTICGFKRMTRYQPYSAVVAALRRSGRVAVEGPDGHETVRRKKPYELNQNKKLVEQRSVYVKGFGEERDGTQATLEDWFRSHAPGVTSVRMRRTYDDNRKFKGSVFVLFESNEHADAFVALDPAPTYDGETLVIKSKAEYCNEKTELIRRGEMEPSTANVQRYFEGREVKSGYERDGRERDPASSDRTWGGRGGRGRGRAGFRGGRGERGSFRGGRGGRGGHRNRDHDQRGGKRQNKAADEEGEGGETDDSEPPRDAAYDATAAAAKKDPVKKTTPTQTNGKRARDEKDGEAEEPTVKKVDAKKVEVEVVGA